MPSTQSKIPNASQGLGYHDIIRQDTAFVSLKTWRSTLLGRPLYLLYALIKLFLVKSPYWFLKYFIFRRLPNKTWTALQAFMTDATWSFLYIQSRARLVPGTYNSIPGSLFTRSSHFIWIPPVDSRYLSYGATATRNAKGIATLQSKRLPAFWYAPPHRLQSIKERGLGQTHSPVIRGLHKHAKDHDSNGVVLYLHGGAYIACSTGEHDLSSVLIKRMSKQMRMDVLAVEYRLALKDPYPAQLQDAVTSYLYLTLPAPQGLGIASHKIMICGDSAGANLGIALLRWIQDAKAQGASDVKEPGCAFLLSPWIDLTLALSVAAGQSTTDIVSTEFGNFGRTALLQGHNRNMVYDPHISPIYDSPQRLAEILPKHTYIAIGGGEVLRPENEIFVTNARKGRKDGAYEVDDEGSLKLPKTLKSRYLQPREDGYTDEENGIVFDVTTDCIHDFPATPMFGGETARLYDRVISWTDKVLG